MDVHSKHRGVGTVLGVKVSDSKARPNLYVRALKKQVKKEIATNYGSIVYDQASNQMLHYVEKPDSWISNTVNGGVYCELPTDCISVLRSDQCSTSRSLRRSRVPWTRRTSAPPRTRS